MTEQEVQDHLHKILIEQFDIEAGDIHPDADMYEELGIDSIDAVDLIVRLKELTGLRIPPEEFKKVRTVGDVTKVVNSLLK